MPADHAEPAPINDTDEAKGLAPDPQLQEVERREQRARDQGQPQDEAQARAWAEVNAGNGRPADGTPVESEPHADRPGTGDGQGEVSVGG